MEDVININLVKWLIFDRTDLTQVEIANMTGLSKQLISKYRAGEQDIEKASLKTIRALYDAALKLNEN